MTYEYVRVNGARGETWIPDQYIKSVLLYQLSYTGIFLAGKVRFELTRCITTTTQVLAGLYLTC